MRLKGAPNSDSKLNDMYCDALFVTMKLNIESIEGAITEQTPVLLQKLRVFFKGQKYSGFYFLLSPPPSV